MRYTDHTNCKTAFEKGEDHEIQSLGQLTRTATKIVEAKRPRSSEEPSGLLQDHQEERPRSLRRRPFQLR